MVEFLRRNRVFLTSGFFLSLSLGLLSANRGGTHRIDPLGIVFLEALQPLQTVTSAVADRAAAGWAEYVKLVDVNAENQRLRDAVQRLTVERHRMRELELETERLERLLDFRKKLPSNAVTARVIGRDASEWFQTFTLDRGESDGIKPGMAVVHAAGVVGRVAQVSPNAARVLLIADHNSGVDALVQRTRARGIVEGTLAGHCSMKYIRHDEGIQPGDVIVTSGLDGLFPKGLLIGRVVDVTRKDYGLFQVAEVVPAVDFTKLEEVLVVTTPPAVVNAGLDRIAPAERIEPPAP
ncbi:MAG: rod shape-determining protein MreC [Candidatus Binatota bacterium]|jgi:rod shape-determining protein MreC|nr:rod shape-determining protein MreC [Candidatus Binatota bacterium]